MDDTTAQTAAVKGRDGDGDGFVHDGTPQMRPVIPGFDEVGPDLPKVPKVPKVPGGQQVADTVKVRRNRVGNVDTPRLKRRRRRLIDEIDDSSAFYPSGRHGFAMRAAELTVIESELERRGELSRRDRYTTTIKPPPPTIPTDRPAGDRVLDHEIDDWGEFFDGLTLANGSVGVTVTTQDNRTRAYSFDPHTSVTLNLTRKSTGRPLGSLSFKVKDRRIDADFGDVHFDHANIDPSARGEGLGTQAFAAAVDTFTLLGFRQMTVDAQSGGAWGNPMANYNGGYTWARAGFDWADRPAAQAVGRRLVQAAKQDDPLSRSLGFDVPEGAAALGHRLSRADFDADDFPTPNDVAMLGWTPEAKNWWGRKFLSRPLGEPNNEFVWKGRLQLNDWPEARSDPNPFAEQLEGGESGDAPKPTRTVYHLTDKARFALDPKKVPEDNALAIRQRDAAGLYVAKDSWDVEKWVNGYGYLRPFVVELDVPEDVLADERWSGEGFIPADRFDDVEVKRVIPVDAFARETYNDFGWVEGTLGARFDDGTVVPERRFDQPHEGLPPGYRYEGPDVRDMDAAEVKRLRDGARAARKARESGKDARSNPFAEQLEGGESGSAATALDWQREAGDIADVPDTYEPPPSGFYNEDVASSEFVVADLTDAGGAAWAEPGADGEKVLWARTPEGQALGYLRYSVEVDEDGDPNVRIGMIRTNPQFARRGVATWLTEALFALEDVDHTRVSATFTEDGALFWNRRFGTDVKPSTSTVMPSRAVEMDDTLRTLVAQRGSRVDAEQLQDAWAAAVADPDDLDAIRAAIPPKQLRSWQQTYGTDAVQAMRMGKGGVPPLEQVLAHNARRLTQATPLTRDNLGVNGMPSGAEIVEHDPEMAEWLGITRAARFDWLRKATGRRQLANLLSDPDPPPEGVRYLKMLRRATERDLDRKGGSVELHRANTQGTVSPFDTKGGSGLTSWTTDYATAAKYAKGDTDVASIEVPADRILSYDTFGIMASTGFWDFSGQDSYPLPGREVLVTSPEVIDRLDRDEFPLLGPVRTVIADDGVEMAMAEPIAELRASHTVERDWTEVRGVAPERRAAIAAAYAELPEDAEPTPEARRSWDRAAAEIDEQYGRLTGELGVTVEFVDTDPYPSFAEMYDDYRRNRRLRVLRTSSTGSHPYWSDETNDRFRAIHDAFGHLATGRGFDRHGEEAAFQAHVSMFSGDAQPALVTELRGQNAALIETGEFAEQKVGVLPADVAAVIAAMMALAGVQPLTPADADNLYHLGGTHHASNGRHFAARTAAVDGDGDGFVYDGTPRMRPALPSEMVGPGDLPLPESPNAKYGLDYYTGPLRQRDGKLVGWRPCGRCGGSGRYAGGVCYGCQGKQGKWVDAKRLDGQIRRQRELDVEAAERRRERELNPPDPAEVRAGRRERLKAALAEQVGALQAVSLAKRFDPLLDVLDDDGNEPLRVLYGDVVGGRVGTKRWTKAERAQWIADAIERVTPERNPFSEQLEGGEAGRAPSSRYPGMRPVTPDERKALRVEGRPIPPAWTDVYVAEDPDADMLARGLDRKGRGVYIYSAAHDRRKAAAKYERTKQVAARIGALDEALERDAMDDPTAAATMLIRHFGLRPGSTADTKARKKAYGATTLQARHVKQYPETGRTTLSFMGKSGQKITVSTRDPRIYELMDRWTAGKSGTTPLFDTTDGRVLLYVKQHLGEEFLTKDLRTLLANTMALDMVSSMRRPTTQAKFKAARNKVADAIAKALGNTRQVTLSNYIDPTVFAAWEGALPA